MDHNTAAISEHQLNGLTAIICGDHGLVYRTNRDLKRLFDRAGIPVPREGWASRHKLTREALIAAQREPGGLERVLAYLVDPAENMGSTEAAERIVKKVDALLSSPTATLENSIDKAVASWTQRGRSSYQWTGNAMRSLAFVKTATLLIRITLPAQVDLLLRDSHDPSLEQQVRNIDRWHAVHVLRVTGRRKFVDDLRLTLRHVGRIAPMLRPLTWDPRRAIGLSDESLLDLVGLAPKLQRAGFEVLVPTELSPTGRPRLRMQMTVGEKTAGIGLAAMTGFRWQVALGDETLTEAEFRAIAEAKREVVRVRGQWVQVGEKDLAEIERLLSNRGEVSTVQALGAALGAPATDSDLEVDVFAAGAVKQLLETITAKDVEKDAPQPVRLVGELRGYQRRGVSWMRHLEEVGFGGCLADDMGLGKTVEVIALQIADEPKGPVLIVCPTSVVANWEREFERFAPDVEVVRHHGTDRPKAFGELGRGVVVVTTYGILRRDHAMLANIQWQRVVLDEAQNIKNPRAAVSRAARKLQASTKLTLTGTPVENRLTDLWSLMEFSNPGLLGPLDVFRRRVANRAERGDQDAAGRLRRVVRPFVLRRLKSDPEVEADLPPKVEMSVVVPLTPEQATLYQAAVDESLAAISELSGIQRRGRILALITALKQICDHPALYLRQHDQLTGRSGKLARLTEMLEEVVAEQQAALVFTQYAQMGHLLVAHLRDSLGAEPPFLHGGVSVAGRQQMMESFQSDDGPQIFVVSLRAGGTGVNLTRASHVFHFDRWWNPAVEDQATDRTHRIGQDKTVFVHKFSTAGTLEERIDAVISDKKRLAEQVVTSGEAWLTELSDSDLREMVALSFGDVEEL